jgi:hypothetical protein
MVQRPEGQSFAEVLVALAATPANQRLVMVKDEEDDIRFMPCNWKKTRRGKSEVARRGFVGRVTDAFANSTSVEMAFSKIGTAKQRKEFVEVFGEADVQKDMAVRIRGRWAKAMKWLHYGLKDEKTCEEAYWRCVWCYVEPEIEVMLEIKNRISSNVPLTDDQYNLLDKHMSTGFPQSIRLEHLPGEGEKYELILMPKYNSLNQTRTELATTATMILAQPAFHLACELQRACSKPRFVRKCHAPSCGKRFYTRREYATACPGSLGDKKNKCALEWIRYKRWMQKTGRAPEKDWDNNDFKRQFISSDND